MTDKIWRERRTLAVAPEPFTYEQAQAHLELCQRPACVVREGARGPRDGRGKMHFNATAEWPASWRPNKFDRYWAVIEARDVTVVDDAQTEGADADHAADALVYGMGALTKVQRLAAQYGVGAARFMASVNAQAQVRTTPYFDWSPEPEPDRRKPRREWRNK